MTVNPPLIRLTEASVSTEILAALVDAAHRPGHYHLEHAKWDADGAPCYRCQCVDEVRAIVGYPCRSCVACDAAREPARNDGGAS